MEWNKEKTLLLIKEFHQRPGLWNMTHDDYRKKETKKTLLTEIAQKFDHCVTPSDIERKFHTLRTQYHREISRMNSSRGPEPYKSKWFAFQQLKFLNDPNACRNTKDSRRRNSTNNAKMVYFQNLKVDTPIQPPTSASTPIAGIHNLQVVTEKDPKIIDNINLRKDLRVLFEEAVDSEDEKNEEEKVTDAGTMSKGIGYVQEEIQLHNKMNTVHNTCYEEEHLVEETVQQHHSDTGDPLAQDEEQYHHQMEQSPVKIYKNEPSNTGLKRSHEIYQDLAYEAVGDHVQTTIPVAKKVYKDAETVVTPTTLTARDEFSIFGECVANELRFLTDRQILVSVKHKINTALFEASIAQLRKNGDG